MFVFVVGGGRRWVRLVRGCWCCWSHRRLHFCYCSCICLCLCVALLFTRAGFAKPPETATHTHQHPTHIKCPIQPNPNDQWRNKRRCFHTPAQRKQSMHFILGSPSNARHSVGRASCMSPKPACNNRADMLIVSHRFHTTGDILPRVARMPADLSKAQTRVYLNIFYWNLGCGPSPTL